MSGPLATVQKRLGEVRSTLKTLYAADWLGRVLVFAAIFVAITFFLDYFLILPSPIRVIFLLSGLGYVGYLSALRLLKPMSLTISDDDLALLVERENPELGYRLISSIQLQRSYGQHPEFNSPELIDALVGETATRSESIDFKRVITSKPVVKTLGAGGALALVLAGLAIAQPVYAQIYAERIVGFNTRWPQKTFFKVVGVEEGKNEIVIARGDDLPILVEVSGEIPSRVHIEYEFPRSNEEGKERMPSLGNNRFQYVFQQVLEEFTFRIVAHNADTDPYRVRILSPPSVGDPDLYCTYPPYLRLKDTPADQPERDPNLRIPLHTRVRVRAVADSDVEHAELLVGAKDKARIVEIKPENDGDGRPRVLTADFEVDKDNVEYSFRVRGNNGLWNRNPLRYALKGQPDLKPVVQVIRPRIAVEEVTRECQKRILLKVVDDHGIAAIRMKYRKVVEGEPKYLEKLFGAEELVPPQYGERNLTVTYVLDFRALAVVEGEGVEALFVAEDYKDIGSKNESESRTVYTFKIIPLSELQKKLEQEISRIKDELGKIRNHQQALQGRTDWLRGKFQNTAELKTDDVGEIRGYSLEQHSITDRVMRIAKEIEHVRERGVENIIFDEKSDKALGRVVGMLDYLTSDRSQPPGPSYSAAQALHNAWRINRADIRDEQFLTARRLQAEVLQTLDVAIQILDLWSTYMEIILAARQLYDAQRDVAKRAEMRRKCGTCRTGNICPVHR